MLEPNTVIRRLGRWGLRLLIVAVILIGIQVSLLAFPQVIMSTSQESGPVKIYFDEPVPKALGGLAEQVDARLQGSGFYDSTGTERVYVFADQGFYKFFVRLALLDPVPQGFNLSVFGNSFVSYAQNQSLAARTGGLPRFSIFEGDLSHIIAHEIGHQYLTDRIGRDVWLQLPHWKREGLPEYIANIGVIRKDTTASLQHRYELLTDDRVWGTTRRADRYGWDRLHYKAGLLVEYLFEECGYRLEDVVADSVTEARVRSDLSEWYAAKSESD